jgi:hypothetical protein
MFTARGNFKDEDEQEDEIEDRDFGRTLKKYLT